MASITSKSGKCSNFGNCSLADSRATVDVPSGLDFVCTECNKPLLLMDAGKEGHNSKTLVIGALLLLLVLAAGSTWWALRESKPPVSISPPASVPPPVSVSPPAPEVQAPQISKKPEPPAQGHCSDADAKAGVCRPAN